MKNVCIISGADGPTAIYISKRKKHSPKKTILVFGGTLFAAVGLIWLLLRHFITCKAKSGCR